MPFPLLPATLRYLAAHLRPTGAVDGSSFEGSVDGISQSGIVVRIRDRGALGIETEDANVGSVLTAFCEAYGTAFDLDVVSDRVSLWTGPVQVHQVEALPSTPDALLLGFAFARELSPDELRTIERGSRHTRTQTFFRKGLSRRIPPPSDTARSTGAG